LEAANQHRPVLFLQHIPENLDDVVWPDPYPLHIEARLMQLAEGQAFRNSWDAERSLIGLPSSVYRVLPEKGH